MKKLLLEKILVYTSLFILCFIISLNEGASSSNVEQKFLNDISSTMKNYNYVETESECLTCDLTYIYDDNSIKFEYNAYTEDVKIHTIDAEFNLNYTSDLNRIYSLLSELYSDNISAYSNEIQKMINDYTTTGEEQMWQDLNSDRQLTLRINKTTSVGKDYQFYYSINAFNR